MGEAAEITEIIKRGVFFRAKYHEEFDVILKPEEAVPHPENRGGEEVNPNRTREISAAICHGYDAIEANSNGVAVQQPPKGTAQAEVEEAGCVFDFQAHYEKSITVTKTC